MKIEVLGTGCAKCHLLENSTKKVADRLGIEYTLDHVTDISKITDYGVMMTPALAIDGQVRLSGKVPSEAEIEKILRAG
jgi:small redox-active disulfide protein 2